MYKIDMYIRKSKGPISFNVTDTVVNSYTPVLMEPKTKSSSSGVKI